MNEWSMNHISLKNERPGVHKWCVLECLWGKIWGSWATRSMVCGEKIREPCGLYRDFLPYSHRSSACGGIQFRRRNQVGIMSSYSCLLVHCLQLDPGSSYSKRYWCLCVCACYYLTVMRRRYDSSTRSRPGKRTQETNGEKIKRGVSFHIPYCINYKTS